MVVIVIVVVIVVVQEIGAYIERRTRRDEDANDDDGDDDDVFSRTRSQQNTAIPGIVGYSPFVLSAFGRTELVGNSAIIC